jgi:DNA repair protein RecO (recombination protein O)
MFRHSFSKVIILHVYNLGECHRGLTVLTPDKGIISVIAHGAKKIKSRFRSMTETFTLVKVYLYYDPVRQSYKVTDMEALETFPNIRKSLVRFYTASLWTEIVLKSFGGGENGAQLFDLLALCLRKINTIEEHKIIYLSIQFIWRFIRQSGNSPLLDECEKCGRTVIDNETLYLGANHLRCADCAQQRELMLLPGARQYILRSTGLPLEDALRIKLENKSLIALKNILYILIQRMLETRLKSIECTGGVI